MDFLASQAIAYLKIVSLALVIMAVVWGMARIFQAFHNRLHPPADGNDHD